MTKEEIIDYVYKNDELPEKIENTIYSEFI